MADLKRKIAAILAADVAGYSRLVALDEENTLRRLAAYREVFDDFVHRAGGRIFNTAGDSVMCEFASAVEATRCAIDIQESLRTRNLDLPQDRRLQFRIGISIGDVVERGGDLLGDGVNIAARLEGLAEPGGICVSRSVYEAVANKISLPFRDLGQQEVKNIPQPVHAFLVDWQGGKQGAPLPGLAVEGAGAPARASSRALWAALAVLVAVALAGGAFLVLRPAPVPSPTPQALADRPAPQPQASKQATPPATSPPAGAAPAASTPAAAPPKPAMPDNATPAEAFAALARAGGIVPDARTPAEHYHNARLYEARGDQAAARRAYLALADLGTDHLDPHLRFSALLRVQDGRAGAREVYAELAARKATRAIELVRALQFEGDERRVRVETFARLNPDYGPAQFLLADEYSQDRLGSQTIADRRAEYEALGRFLQAEKDGTLAALFLDHALLAQWLDRARIRHANLDAVLRNAGLAPTANFVRSNTGWMVALSLPEAATEIDWKLGDAPEFKPTGSLNTLDQRTGKPMPNTSFELPVGTGSTTLHVRYRDARGLPQGPFEIAFDPSQALVAMQRDVLTRMPGSWVAFRKDPPFDRYLYFTHLMSYRCAISKAMLGIDGGPLEIDLPMPPCDERDPYALPPDARPYLTLPPAAKSVSVQLTFVDGTTSDIQVFRRD
jgi:class 3 adenylate cyclase